MRRFARLYDALDRTTRTHDKVAALEAYFAEAPAADAAWAIPILSGQKLVRAVSGRNLRRWAAEETGYPDWLIDASHAAVGDLSETLADLLGAASAAPERPLHRVIEASVLPLDRCDEAAARRVIAGAWAELPALETFLYLKLIRGSLRVGVSRKLVVRALAERAGLEAAVIAHRLSGAWRPSAAAFRALLAPVDERSDPARPYPFFLAQPIEEATEELGPVDDWQIEWKWDGTRAQLIRRAGRPIVWSRGEELVTDAFPEIREAARGLPEGTVADGEIVAWEDGEPLPFSLLQRRLNRKSAEPALFREVPVAFLAFDLLEDQGTDIRARPQDERRRRLEAVVADLEPEGAIRLSPLLPAPSWDELAERLAEARRRGAEGFMLKRRDAAYGVGRPRGPWWKWKVPPYTVDAVLVYAEHGHGKRAGLFTDYTFAAWDGDALLPVAKAYSGLSDREIGELDRWIRRNTVARHGPVHEVAPSLVLELAFERVQPSARHKSGLAVRFPRMRRRRDDKRPEDADRIESLRALIPEKEAPKP